MEKGTRIREISKIIKQDPLGKQEIMWQDELVTMPVYKIPLKYLLYNKYNGRILSRTKSLESQKIKINPESEAGKKTIEKLLWDSKIDRNKRTKEDMEKYGQKKVGIITRDGIIIDGNRRAMILNRIEKFDYFKAVVLPVTLEENPTEIEKLETSYQMGEDEKLDYNPIEKYLKSKNLKQKNIDTNTIAAWMGQSSSIVEGYLDVMKIMDDYLDYLDYKDMYTQLDNREDLFISLTKWVNTFYGEKSTKAFDGYKDSDVDDLKIIAFDYIRARYEGKNFRSIADGLKDKHMFGNKVIWEFFKHNHFKNISPIYKNEKKVNLKSANLTSTLNDRDENFRLEVLTLLDDGLNDGKSKVDNQIHKNEPEKLITKAIDSLNVAKNNRNINRRDVTERLEKLNEMTNTILSKDSPDLLLKNILKLLRLFKIGGDTKGEGALLGLINEIEKETFQIKKIIKQDK